MSLGFLKLSGVSQRRNPSAFPSLYYLLSLGLLGCRRKTLTVRLISDAIPCSIFCIAPYWPYVWMQSWRLRTGRSDSGVFHKYYCIEDFILVTN